MDASDDLKSMPADLLPKEILGRLDNLYPKLAPVAPSDPVLHDFGSPALEMPTQDILSTRVSECSFEVFSDPVSYFQNPRAKEFVSWSAPRSDVYRIYFNTQSKKVYVDLNGKRWNEIRSKLEEELLFCDILRTLIWVLTCEVETFEAREAEKSAEAVTADVVEVVIP